MPHTGPLPSTATPEEPIRWNRVRRRSSGRAARPPVDNTAPVDNEVVVCEVPDQQKVQDAADCSRSGSTSMLLACQVSVHVLLLVQPTLHSMYSPQCKAYE